MERVKAEDHEQDQQSNSEDLKSLRLLNVYFDQSGRPSHAENPNHCKTECDPVKLVVDQLVVLVNFKNKRVVYTIFPKDLDVHTCCEEDKNQDVREVVHV